MVDGQLVDNGPNLDHKTLCSPPERCARIITQLSLLAGSLGPKRPDLILPVGPRDAQVYARGVALARGVSYMSLHGLARSREAAARRHDERPMRRYDSIVLVGTVIINRGDVMELLKDDYIAERATGLVAIWDRGRETDRPPLPDGLQQRAIVEEYMPAMAGPYETAKSRAA